MEPVRHPQEAGTFPSSLLFDSTLMSIAEMHLHEAVMYEYLSLINRIRGYEVEPAWYTQGACT